GAAVSAGVRAGWQSGRDVPPVAVDVIILPDHAPQVHADPRLDPLGRLPADVGGPLRVLDRLRTAHGIDHAVELAEHGIARRVDDAPLAPFDDPARALVELADQRGGAFLVASHHAAEADHVDHENGRELAPRCGGLRSHAEAIITHNVDPGQASRSTDEPGDIR